MIYNDRKTKNISFPLGGIGTGCIGLAGNGELTDWEIFNRPNKCSRNGFSHFAIKVKRACDETALVRVLHGDTCENLMGTTCKSNGYYGFGFGPRENSMAGFPHFKNVTFKGEFPTAEVTFEDSDFPANVKLLSFNPFIPHNEYDSSLPTAFFEWEIENTTSETLSVALACTVCNPARSTYNKEVASENAIGAFLGSADQTDSEIGYSDLCILTDKRDGVDTVVQEYWYRGNWKDGCTTYWKNLALLDRMPKRHYNAPQRDDHATVASYTDIPPKERVKLRFVISWNVPVAYNYWTEPADKESYPTWRNYYATQFADSFESAKYAVKHFETLLEKTVTFSEALQSCTLSEAARDAISSNLSVLKSPTVLRLDNGEFWAWEGCMETVGSCFGTCQHVWNYAYAMPYLFPRLERSIRETTLKYALMDSGKTSFRVDLPLQRKMSTARACVDGQMGEVIKCYREWKLSGDNEWIEKHAESIFKMLEYAWSPENDDKWDADMDGVIEGRQHHTLDMELFGPNSWLEGFYLLALSCGAEIAKHAGDENRVGLYTRLYENGRKWLNDQLFNGRYFCQKLDLSDRSILDRFGAADAYWNNEAEEIKYQVADGCIIDQMLADWHAALIGMNGVFDTEKKKTALRHIYKYNYKKSMRKVTNMWRNFSLNDERGTVICAYPDDVKTPAIPIPYCEETMTGFEYALAGLMIANGYISEGEDIVKAIRDRYDGEKRNPWNEIECGSNYARSMASYALLPIYSGFTFDMTEYRIGFAPLTDSGSYLFSVCNSWGKVEFDGNCYRISILGDPLTLRSVSIPICKDVTSVTADGVRIDFKAENGAISFEKRTICREICLK